MWEALITVGRTFSNRSTWPVLSNIYLKAEGGLLHLRTSNLEASTLMRVPADITKEGGTTVPAKTLTALVGALDSDMVAIELNQETETLNISAGSMSANIKGISLEEFPSLEIILDQDVEFKVSLPARQLSDMVAKVGVAAATDTARPVLAGVNFHFNGGTLDMAATDGFRLSHYEFDDPTTKSAAGISIVLPAGSLAETIKMIADKDDEVIVSKRKAAVVFETGNITFIFQTIEGRFPDYAAVIPQKHTTRIVVDRADFLKACRTVSIFAREAHNICFLSYERNGSEEGVVTIEATSSETGSSHTQIPAQIEGDNGKISFNLKYLLDAVRAATMPKLVLEMESAGRPGVIREAGPDNQSNRYLHLIMPVQAGN